MAGRPGIAGSVHGRMLPSPGPMLGNADNGNIGASNGAPPGMGGSLAGVDLGPSMLSAAGPPPNAGPTMPAGTGPGGTPTTALSVYHLITQLCQRPEPNAPSHNRKHASASPPPNNANDEAVASNSDAAQINNGADRQGATSPSDLDSLPGSSAQREHALLELSKKREQYEDLALVLWHSFGVMSSLLQEIVSVYPLLSPPALTAQASNRVCNALALLQCVASHSETRGLFLQAHIPLFLYPFLNTTSKTRPFEYLRLTSLGVIGALVKQNDNSDVITFLLSTEIIPLCLRIMETGSELSKTVAIFIVQKILLDDMGLAYICQTYERFYAVGTVLSNMVSQIVESQAVRLLKHVVRCYLRLSDNPRAREALRACLPGPLRDATFSQLLKNDHITKRCLATLLLNLSDRVEQ
ncbi:probable rcd1 protein involved in sexual development [Melanopsichium pennsylvanicum]|uniref:Probable rcd1 protein involved in sexual development n=2 Tax=Melanopsichium pennsylvanicum TaxID=63383 RepID=A0AAJ5C8N9_9BASI|nr:probable rcd1 protein involved in sexual development [Melanopsichium pennsylvanicum 4]SNX87719.1 probable rcd1 protein involved in sexual development [Melanopsichium pennsylvanicum]